MTFTQDPLFEKVKKIGAMSFLLSPVFVKKSDNDGLSFEIFVCIHFLKFNQKVAQGVFGLETTLRQSLVNRRQFLLFSFPKSERLKGVFLFFESKRRSVPSNQCLFNVA